MEVSYNQNTLSFFLSHPVNSPTESLRELQIRNHADELTRPHQLQVTTSRINRATGILASFFDVTRARTLGQRSRALCEPRACLLTARSYSYPWARPLLARDENRRLRAGEKRGRKRKARLPKRASLCFYD